MNKKIERQIFREKLNRLFNSPEIGEIEKKIKTNVANWLNSQRLDTLGFYMALRTEFSVSESVGQWLKDSKGHAAYLPICEGKLMRFARWSPATEMRLGAHNIREPVSEEFGIPQLFLIPCLAITPAGYRLGHGGGYYDRYLKTLQDLGATFTTAGICPEAFVCGSFAPEPHDIPLNYIITEKTVAKISANQR